MTAGSAMRLHAATVALFTVFAAAPAAANPAPSAKPGSTGVAALAHTVQPGDTLSGIAKRYGVTVKTLVRTNGFSSARVRLRVGSRVLVPAGPGPPAPPAKSPGEAKAPTARATKATRASRRAAAAAARRMPAYIVLSVPDFEEPIPPFTWPVEGSVSSNFGRRRMGWHGGVDIVAPSGTSITAAASGLVIASGVEGRYGRVVKIAHENGFVSVYAHNTDNLVELGQWVLAGQPIATVGRTGRATAEHVHFEIRRDGLRYNPLYLLPLPPRIASEEVELDEDEEP
ncbi:MAG: peptidoglycan DD-metalloendopeptidase family protein [Candidatus Rokubacteria bacterium]|nr:peptidoglycan DD-metalloendopeptidase family protein [Candidatus Rokubacteria bacterium]